MFVLKVPNVSGMKESEISEILLSFLSAVTEVAEGRRRVTYLSHFFRERLNKFEKKKLIFILEHFQSQLSKKVTKKVQVSSSTENLELKLPEDFQKYLQFFQNFTS